MRSLVVFTAILAQIACQWAATPHCHASQDAGHLERPHIHFSHAHDHPPIDLLGFRSPLETPHHDDTCIFLAPAVVAVARNGADRPTDWQGEAVDALVTTASPVVEVASSAPPQPPRDVGLPPPADLVIVLRTLRI
jgi:hypothetical protein